LFIEYGFDIFHNEKYQIYLTDKSPYFTTKNVINNVYLGLTYTIIFYLFTYKLFLITVC